MTRTIVVGAGPVGLFLACLLGRRGVEVVVLEKRERRSSGVGSRSIGLHPPALEALDSVGLATPLIECGVPIRRAHVFDEGRDLGSLSLAGCPPPFPFVLSLPQGVTERLLEERLEQWFPGSVRRGAEVAAASTAPGLVSVRLASGEVVEGDFLVACDGHGSDVRRSLRVPTRGGPLGHHYLMADLPDSSELADDAAIYLARAGVVESFPLPGGRRRWVARVSERPVTARFERLRHAVERRTGHRLPPGDEYETSLFTAENRLAHPLAGENWALAGDAAHVVSPIGGQGMNLGLLGAEALLEAGLGESWQPGRYDGIQRRRARRAARRARLNMALGGERVPVPVRRALLGMLFHPLMAARSVRYFTMRGL